MIEVSDANIIAFSANPPKVDPGGSTTLSWQVTQAVRVELHQPNGQIETVDQTGSQVFQVATKSTFKLVAFDSQGRTATKKVTVDVNQPPPPPSNPGTSPDASTTGATTGSPPPTNPPTTTGGSTGTTGR